MKILIAADMEGVTGVVHWDQVSPGHPDYPRFRQLMTADVNAAIRGAFEAGASEVLVSDGHNNGRNILIEDLDERAHLNSGSPSPLSMVQGADMGVEGVFFIGYHARIGTPNAILDHTWSDERVWELRVNGVPFGETALNAGICGQYGVPALMVSGDAAVCAEAQAMLGEVETAVVKWASGRMAAECLPPLVSQDLIRSAAERAIRRLREGQAPAPFQPPAPLEMAVDFIQSEMADRAALLPGASRSGRTVTCLSPDMVTLARLFRTLLALARG